MKRKTKSLARCYNAGKVDNLPYIVAHRNFQKADKYICALGMYPVNPLYNGLHPSAPWILHMIVDIWLLVNCKTVFFQHNWRDSKEAKIEYAVARFMGKEMLFE